MAAALIATKGLSERALNLVDGSSDKLLARSAFAGHDDRYVPARNHLNKVEDLPHRFARADELAGQAVGFDVGGKPPRLAAKLDFTLCVVEQRFEFCEVRDGLGEEVPGPLLDGFDGHIDAAARRYEQNGPLGIAGLQVAEQFQPRNFGHDDIGNDDVWIVTVHQLFCFFCISGLKNIKTPALKKHIERFEHGGIVVNDEDLAFACCHCRLRIAFSELKCHEQIPSSPASRDATLAASIHGNFPCLS